MVKGGVPYGTLDVHITRLLCMVKGGVPYGTLDVQKSRAWLGEIVPCAPLSHCPGLSEQDWVWKTSLNKGFVHESAPLWPAQCCPTELPVGPAAPVSVSPSGTAGPGAPWAPMATGANEELNI